MFRLGSGSHRGTIRKGIEMRKYLIFLVFNTTLTMAHAQSDLENVHQKTTKPTGGRYEIVQSELAAKWTFRLDRFTGKVSMLVKDDKDNLSWQEMDITKLPTITKPNTPRFLIFTSGLAARNTFLMDCITGNTWELAHDLKDSDDFWDPMW